MERTRGNLPGEQLRWTIEIPWVVEAYQQHRSAAQVESLMACVRRGEIEIGGMYFGLQTDLCGNEELVRSLMFSQELRNAYTIPVRTAFINDTPGMTWSLAQLMPKWNTICRWTNSSYPTYKTTTLPSFHVQAQMRKRLRSIDKTGNLRSVTCEQTRPAIMHRISQLLQTLAGGGYPASR
jgi:hypothetical protein